MAEITLGFLGAGKMATALAKAFLQAGLLPKSSLVASDPVPEARDAFARDTGAKAMANNIGIAQFAPSLILAVKPDQVDAVLAEIRPGFTSNHALFSIAAGISTQRLEAGLPEGSRVVRLMPNTPALVGASATGYALGKHARREDGALAERLFSAVGTVCELKESLLDAVTGLSGSGPAYIFLMIDALSDGGVAAGLPRQVATRLAAQTMMGAAKMVLETGLHPSALKDMVTSPGGTTVEGLHELEKAGVRGALINAVRAASEKSRQLGSR